MQTERIINESELDTPKVSLGETMAVNLRANVSEYTNRVLGVIKEKYGLRDKSEALDKFAEMFGSEFVELEIKEEVLKKMVRICDEHDKKYRNRRMTLKQLDELFGIKNV
jgi:hypothetical protein